MADPAAGYNEALRTHAAVVVAQVTKAWAAVTVADLDASWETARSAVITAITGGQFYAASLATAYQHHLFRSESLTPQGPTLRPQGFAGIASTGGPLDPLVDLAPIRVKQTIATGIIPRQATHAGLYQLVGVADTQLQEASRGVMDVAMNTDPQYRGYLRHPNPGACGRCLILANKFFRRNEGFERHPRCACTHIPILVGQEMLNLPTAAGRFAKLTAAQQDAKFGKDGAEAIRSGADPASVINAQAGMTRAGDSFTREGRTLRSVSGRRIAAAGAEVQKRKGDRYRSVGSRLSPSGCRRIADGDQVQYEKLLRLNGYIV